MVEHEKLVSQDLIYVTIMFALILLGFVSLIFAVKKFGLKRTCRAIRGFVTLHWIFKFIIYLR